MSISDIEEITIDISEENDIIRCEVELIPRGRHCGKKLRVATTDVVRHLAQQGYIISPAQVHERRIYNYKAGYPHKGTWLFTRPGPPEPEPVVAVVKTPKQPSSPKKRVYKKRAPKPKTTKE